MAANNSLVFTDFSSFKRLAELEGRVSTAAFYQVIAQALTRGFHTKRTLRDFAITVARAADSAYALRQLGGVEEVGRLLLNLAISPEIENAGHYYRALALNRGRPAEANQARLLFERVADRGSSHYRARAMLALGGNCLDAGDMRDATQLYKEMMLFRAPGGSFDPVVVYSAARMSAVVRGMTGDHRGAVTDLEQISAIARRASSVQPYAYFDYMNTLAVELGEVGRLEEAQRVSQIALASPFAHAYPEWRETFDDIAFKQRRASRSIVAVATPGEQTFDVASQQAARTDDGVRPQLTDSHNLLHLPAPEPLDSSATNQRSEKTKGRVLDFLQWKTMMKEADAALPDKLAPEQREEMTTGEKLIRLMDLVSRDETDDEMIDRILNAVEEIVLGAQTNIS